MVIGKVTTTHRFSLIVKHFNIQEKENEFEEN